MIVGDKTRSCKLAVWEDFVECGRSYKLTC